MNCCLNQLIPVYGTETLGQVKENLAELRGLNQLIPVYGTETTHHYMAQFQGWGVSIN